QAEDGIRDKLVTGVQTCALPILKRIYLEGGLAETVVYAPTDLYALSPDGKTIVKDEVRDSDHQLMLALYSIEEKKKSYIEYDQRSEEHTSELQSLAYLVCRLLLE